MGCCLDDEIQAKNLGCLGPKQSISLNCAKYLAILIRLFHRVNNAQNRNTGAVPQSTVKAAIQQIFAHKRADPIMNQHKCSFRVSTNF